jgi:hypothetical protein
MKTKNAMARFFLLLGLCTGMAPVQSPAGDVESYVTASKSQWFVQLSAGAPTMINRGFVFSSVVIGTTSNSVLSGRVDSPGHVFGLLDADSAIVNAITFNERFDTKTNLDTLYPSGTYSLIIDTASDGTLTNATMSLPDDMYPADAPHVSNWAAAQAVDSSADFTVMWDAFTGGTNSDFISLAVQGHSNKDIFSSPIPGQPGALDGTATGGVIPAGTLSPGSTYTAVVLFAKVTGIDTNTISGVPGLTAYYKQTFFLLVTQACPDLTGTWTNLVQTCKVKNEVQSCKVKGTLNVQNAGTAAAPTSFVRYYLSDDATFDEGDTLLKQVATGTVKLGKPKKRTLSAKLPVGVNGSGKYIIAVIDADDTVVECDETNNTIVFGPIP